MSVGLLGADYAVENGRYRITHIYTGENWNPELRAPLSAPGIQVAEGDYLLEVNGRPLAPPTNLYSCSRAPRAIRRRSASASTPTGEGRALVTVVPIANEDGLRTRAWIEDNRRKVDSALRRQARLRLAAEHRRRRLHRLHALLLRAAGQGGRDDRRAVQPRRHGRRLHRQRARSQADGLLRHARRQDVDVADGRHLSARR